MKTLKITQTETDLRSAIEKSSQAYGLTAYAPSELNRKIKTLEYVNRFYLVPEGDRIEIYYKVTFKKQLPGGETTKYSILHKFSWTSCLHNRAAAICEIDQENNEIRIGDYKYNRDDLRRNFILWTTA